MSNYTKEKLDEVWKKGRTLDGWNSAEYRLDAAGAMMVRSHRGTDDDYDWEVDHVYPRNKLKEAGIDEDRWDEIDNLRPFNAKNNASKSDEYPRYTQALIFDEANRKNVKSATKRVVNEDVQKGINLCYGFNFDIVEGDHSIE